MEVDLPGTLDPLRGMLAELIARLPAIAVAFLVFLFFLVVAGGIARATSNYTGRRTGLRHAALLSGRLAQWGVGLVGLLVALVIAVPGFTPGRLIELLGLGSIAIGFALRDALQNLFAGLIILWTRPFRIGDQIVTGPFEGTVEEVQTRATFIVTYDGRRVVIPNAQLFGQPVIVNTANVARRIEVDLGIGYGDDLDEALRVLEAAVRATAGVLADPPPDVLVIGFTDNAVQVRVRWWVTPPRRMDVLESQSDGLAAMKRALLAHGIDQPFPTHQVLFHDQTEATDGDRARQREGWPARPAGDPEPARIVDALRTRRE